MKILKYLLGAFAVLLVLYFAMGIMNPSVSYGYEIEVDKPIKEAWAVAKDESKYTEWLDGFSSMEHLTGDYGQVGSTYKVIVIPEEGQPPFEMIETITSQKEFDHITMHFDSEMMDFEQTINYSENDGKTVIKTDSKVLGKGIMMRSMFATMEKLFGAFTQQEGKNMEQLKKLIEANTTDYYPPPAEIPQDSVEVTES